ncbi:Ubiquitin-protein ligase [Chamberlinius hualienensis]
MADSPRHHSHSQPGGSSQSTTKKSRGKSRSYQGARSPILTRSRSRALQALVVKVDEVEQRLHTAPAALNLKRKSSASREDRARANKAERTVASSADELESSTATNSNVVVAGPSNLSVNNSFDKHSRVGHVPKKRQHEKSSEPVPLKKRIVHHRAPRHTSTSDYSSASEDNRSKGNSKNRSRSHNANSQSGSSRSVTNSFVNTNAVNIGANSSTNHLSSSSRADSWTSVLCQASSSSGSNASQLSDNQRASSSHSVANSSTLSSTQVPPELCNSRRSHRIRITGSCASTSRRSSRVGKFPLPGQSSGGSGGSGSSVQGRVSSSSAAVAAASTAMSQENGSDGNTATSAAAATSSSTSAAILSLDDVRSGAAASSSVSGSGSSHLVTSGESESDDNEMWRLQTLLESRGLPPHLFGALAPRMQHLLHRSIGGAGYSSPGASSTSSKAQQLLQGLQATGDEGQQLQAVIEMCQMLVMGNEDTLAGFPVKLVVPALINLLSMEHNFDMMNHACRALAYMMEALPRSSPVVVEAIPAFLEKLQVIQCMDVAEQSLTALEMLSRRHGKAILQARGVSACLMYLDFFSINAQRAALAITANCCQNVNSEEFCLVSESLSLLTTRLTHQDKKSVESVCLCLSRLVDNFQNDSKILQEIASDCLFTNIQQLLVVSPPIISTGTFIMVIRMLSIMCAGCPELAVKLLKLNIAETLCYLLTGTTDSSTGDIELVSRSPQELYELTSLIGELMPKLPTDGIFQVDGVLSKPSVQPQNTVTWQWKDDRDLWHSYGAVDSRILEAAHQSGEDELTLSTMGRTYTIDFDAMQQINDDTGTTRSVQRKVMHQLGINLSSNSNARNSDSRIDYLQENHELAMSFIRSLFGVLYEVYSSSAGPAVRHKCLRALLRMIYFASPDLLKEVLKNQQVSSHIAAMLSSNDLKIVVGALQLCEILMQKLPDIFAVYFRREGVMYQVKRLVNPEVPLGTSPPKDQWVGGANSSSSLGPTSATALTSASSPVLNNSALTAGADGHSVAAIASSSSSSSLPSVISSSCLAVSPIPSNILMHPGHSSSLFSAASTSTSSMSSPPLIVTHQAFSFGGGRNLLLPSVSSLSTSTSNSNRNNFESDDRNETPLPQMRLSEVLKRKRTSKRGTSGGTSGGSSSRKARADEELRDVVAKAAAIPTSSNVTASSSSVFGSGRGHVTSSSSLGPASSNRSPCKPWLLLSSSEGRRGRGVKKTSSEISSKSSFFATFNPTRWGRSNSSSSPLVTRCNPKENSLVKFSSSGGSSSTSGQKEKVKTWIRDQAGRFLQQFFPTETNGEVHPALNILNRLTAAIKQLDCKDDLGQSALREICNIVMQSDISPFELIHSGLVRKLLEYLTSHSENLSSEPASIETLGPSEQSLGNGKVDIRERRLRAFVHVFLDLPIDRYASANELLIAQYEKPGSTPLSALVAKLGACINQLEQFPVKVHDLPSGVGGSRTGSSALKFFNTHQLKCNLHRHPDCANLKQWKGGPVKIDPLALVQAIERYLLTRGYGRLRTDDDNLSDDDNSEDDIDDSMAAVIISQGQARHRLQFLIGEHVLPYNMTVYQAVKQYSCQQGASGQDGHDTDTDTENPVGHAGIWIQTHTIWYRPIPENESAGSSVSSSTSTVAAATSALTTSSAIAGLSTDFSASSGRRGKSSGGKGLSRRKGDDLWNEGNVPEFLSPLLPYLTPNLPSTITVQDASLEVIALLRVLHALNRHWGCLYMLSSYRPVLSPQEFISGKLTAKANRQLLDPLVIMTGNLPLWLSQITYACPFLFPFETRQMLFYSTSFDRDRAMQRLLDLVPELSNTDNNERVTPRLDRKKRMVSRDDLLKQAEVVMQDLGGSRALLEIQYENEVGSGLGPTLEFYALVSKELQRSDLELWRGEDVKASNIRGSDDGKGTSYVHSACGLFPSPLGRSCKAGHVTKIRNKFKILGKFMAKALMDSRLLDIPLSSVFYKWLLGKEATFSSADLEYVDKQLATIIYRMEDVVRRKQILLQDQSLSPSSLKSALESLTMDGCPIESMQLDFTLPGYSSIELIKGGKNMTVTIHNLELYLKLVLYWTLVEGVSRQMEMYKESFESVFPLTNLQMFYPEELEMLFCGSSTESWDTKVLVECCRIDHGYTHESRVIKCLFKILSSYKQDEQRQFLHFVTGSPRLPVGGFKSLSPPLTIVRKTLETNENADDFLPSVMTCVNYLKLPEYSSIEIMRQKLRVAAQEGQHSFHLS